MALVPSPMTAVAATACRFSSAHLLLLFICFCCSINNITAPQTLAPEEVQVLRQVGLKLKIWWWDFNVDPCSGTNGWADPGSDTFVSNNLACGCETSFVNNECHVVSISLKSQNLSGILPPDLANLTSLVQIDLTRNDISGPIPPEWSSLPLVNISLGGNRLTGFIPPEIGNIATLQSLVLENNMLQGPIPSSLGRLTSLTRLIISANDFTGELPSSLGNLRSLADFRIDGTSISGIIPNFIGNWAGLQKLHLQGTSMEGSFPSALSILNLIELRVSDFKGDGSFPPLESMNLHYLILRNCSISGSLPAYIGSMTALKELDLSFNNFTGEIPSSYSGLDSSINYMYLTNNMLSGAIPSWILASRQTIDLSYNNFLDSSAPSSCEQRGTPLNVVASCSSSANSMINPCLRKNFPCSGNPTNQNFFINCGGSATTVGSNLYEEDTTLSGTSTFFLSYNEKWAMSSTGYFFDNKDALYIATSNIVLNMTNPEIYTTARLSASSLKYYGLCLINGNYTVSLHFAEIMFTDDQTYCSVGRRFFDVSIQGEKVLEDFNIVAEANGTGREVIKSFVAYVVSNTLEIHLQWSGKGTNSIPQKGVYGPLISAITVSPYVPGSPPVPPVQGNSSYGQSPGPGNGSHGHPPSPGSGSSGHSPGPGSGSHGHPPGSSNNGSWVNLGTSPSKKLSGAGIAGIAVGSPAALALLLLFLFCIFRSRQSSPFNEGFNFQFGGPAVDKTDATNDNVRFDAETDARHNVKLIGTLVTTNSGRAVADQTDANNNVKLTGTSVTINSGRAVADQTVANNNFPFGGPAVVVQTDVTNHNVPFGDPAVAATDANYNVPFGDRESFSNEGGGNDNVKLTGTSVTTNSGTSNNNVRLLETGNPVTSNDNVQSHEPLLIVIPQ